MPVAASLSPDNLPLSLGQKLLSLNWPLVFLIGLTAAVGFVMLYSAAGGDLDPWARRQMIRFAAGCLIMLAVALTDLRFWMRWAYLFYAVALALLVAVEIKGTVGMGAQRWINLGFINVQPSELMKITLVLALARYFHRATLEDSGRLSFLLIPLVMVAAPAFLVLRQPDLGTALLLIAGSGVIFWLAGVQLWKFGFVFLSALIAIPVGWSFLLDYQKNRVLTFLDPERDPLGAGYHIMQSKIALGSGGMFGKGFLLGSQSHLNFLPEKQTDFVFTMLAEEFGMVGGIGLLTLYALIMIYGYWIALRCRSQFGRMVAMGVMSTFFLYVFINIAMVMGLIPVVGVPLPLVSYGGTVMLTILFSFGLVMSVSIHKDVRIGRNAADEE